MDFLKPDQVVRKDLLAISSALAAVGAAYLFIRQEVPSYAVDPLWLSIQDYISEGLPKIFSSLKNLERPQLGLKENVGQLDTIMAVITFVFSIESIRQIVRIIVNRMKEKSHSHK